LLYMMGKGHMAVGAAEFLCLGSLAASIAGQSLSPAELSCGALVAGGAALLPDLDCPTATIAHSLGPVSHTLSRIVNKLAGGHRKGTHSLLAWVLVSLGLSYALYGSDGRYVALGAVFLCASMCLRLLTDARGVICSALAAIVAVAVTVIAPSPGWLLLACIIGYLSHLGADFITVDGVPLLWPVKQRSQKLAFIGRTESFREKLVARSAGLIALYVLALTLVPIWLGASNPSPRPSTVQTVVMQRTSQKSRSLRDKAHRPKIDKPGRLV
jgi:membrane-bound metal-dependent hydrolase YbcI (DUF457 family)